MSIEALLRRHKETLADVQLVDELERETDRLTKLEHALLDQLALGIKDGSISRPYAERARFLLSSATNHFMGLSRMTTILMGMPHGTDEHRLEMRSALQRARKCIEDCERLLNNREVPE